MRKNRFKKNYFLAIMWLVSSDRASIHRRWQRKDGQTTQACFGKGLDAEKAVSAEVDRGFAAQNFQPTEAIS